MTIRTPGARCALRQALTILLLLVSTSCDRGLPTTAVQEKPAGPLNTRADSLAFEAWARTNGLTPRFNVSTSSTSTAIPMLPGDRAIIRLLSAECARAGNTISVYGIVSGTLTRDACYDVGATLALGPAITEGGFGFSGNGKFMVEGTYPRFTVKFEDSGDDDYNDAVISVQIVTGQCDPLLQDSAFRGPLELAVQRTGWSLPLAQRTEYGGWMTVNPEGEREFVEFAYTSQGPCHAVGQPGQLASLLNTGYTILGTIHTHPTDGSRLPDPGNCMTYDPGSKQLVPVQPGPDGRIDFDKGPSQRDLAAWSNGNNPGWPGYVIEPPGRVYRWERDGEGKLRRTEFAFYAVCPASPPPSGGAQ
ncbi:MAG TPA: hypothetical protein VF584_18745 [Longimicrobium sp.]|jgi:hypothetical protein